MVEFMSVALGAKYLKIGGYGFSALRNRDNMVYMQADAVRHVFAASLAGVIVPDFNLFTQFCG